MVLNFNWITTDDDNLYKDYVEAYNNGLTLTQIEKELGLSKNRQHTFFKHAREEGLLNLKKNRKPKYYYYSKFRKCWVVKRKTKKSFTSIGCQSEEQAKKVVERLNLKNWSKNEAKIIREIIRSGGEV